MYRHFEDDELQFRTLLQKTLDVSVEYLDSINERPLATEFVRKTPLSLPAIGIGAGAALELFKERYGDEMPASSGAGSGASSREAQHRQL